MPSLKSILEKYFEEPFLQAELYRAEFKQTTGCKQNYQGKLATELVKNYRAFQTWAAK